MSIHNIRSSSSCSALEPPGRQYTETVRRSNHPSVNPSARDSNFSPSSSPLSFKPSPAQATAKAMYPLYEYMIEECIRSNQKALLDDNHRLQRELDVRDKEIVALRLELTEAKFLQKQQDHSTIQQPRVHDFGKLTEEVLLPFHHVCKICKKRPPNHVYECGHQKVCKTCANMLFGCPVCVQAECKDNYLSKADYTHTQVADK